MIPLAGALGNSKKNIEKSEWIVYKSLIKSDRKNLWSSNL